MFVPSRAALVPVPTIKAAVAVATACVDLLHIDDDRKTKAQNQAAVEEEKAYTLYLDSAAPGPWRRHTDRN